MQSERPCLGVFTRVEIAVILDTLISRSLRSTHAFCVVLLCFFSASLSRLVAYRIISCDLLFIKLMCAYMFMFIVVASPS